MLADNYTETDVIRVSVNGWRLDRVSPRGVRVWIGPDGQPSYQMVHHTDEQLKSFSEWDGITASGVPREFVLEIYPDDLRALILKDVASILKTGLPGEPEPED